jgi:hypothetical protein
MLIGINKSTFGVITHIERRPNSSKWLVLMLDSLGLTLTRAIGWGGTQQLEIKGIISG